MPIPSRNLKCTKCGKVKKGSEFYKRTNGNLQAECKLCTRTRSAKRYWSEKHDAIRQKENSSMKRKRARARNIVFTAYGGYKCVCCGETEPSFLSIDHINNDGGADFRRKNFGKRTSAGCHTYAWLIRNNFPEGFQVLCMNCQHGKRMNAGICPHQIGCNDYPEMGVGLSSPKRGGPLSAGQDIVCSISKDIAVH